MSNYKVKFEMTFQDKFDVILLNDDLEESLVKAEKLYTSFHQGELEITKKPFQI